MEKYKTIIFKNGVDEDLNELISSIYNCSDEFVVLDVDGDYSFSMNEEKQPIKKLVSGYCFEQKMNRIDLLTFLSDSKNNRATHVRGEKEDEHICISTLDEDSSRLENDKEYSFRLKLIYSKKGFIGTPIEPSPTKYEYEYFDYERLRKPEPLVGIMERYGKQDLTKSRTTELL